MWSIGRSNVTSAANSTQNARFTFSYKTWMSDYYRTAVLPPCGLRRPLPARK